MDGYVWRLDEAHQEATEVEVTIEALGSRYATETRAKGLRVRCNDAIG